MLHWVECTYRVPFTGEVALNFARDIRKLALLARGGHHTSACDGEAAVRTLKGRNRQSLQFCAGTHGANNPLTLFTIVGPFLVPLSCS
jgi:hypothetical protein